MKLDTFFNKFDQFADAPDAVVKMRELVLDLAIQGRLVEPRASDGDGHSLLKKLRTLPPERNSKSRSPKDIVVEPETPLEIPSHWALTTVENTTRDTGFFCDGDWVESKDQDPDGDVRLIQLADVGDGQYRDRSSRFMTKEAATRLHCSYLEPGDILVARMPDPLGRCCRFPGDSKPAVTVVDVCILRPNATFFDPDFLVVAINCPRFRRLVSAQATGTTRSRISRSNLGVLPIPLPPLAEQKRIVAKVDELMALCDRLEAQQQERETRHAALARASLARFADAPTPANLPFLFHRSYAIPPADLRKSILTLAVQGKLVPLDPNDEPAEASFPKLASLAVESEDDDSPAHWLRVPLGKMGEWRGGGTPSKSRPEFWKGDLPWVSPKDMKVLHIADAQDHVSPAAVEGSSVRLIPPGSLLMVVRGMILARAFPVALTMREVTINQDMKALLPTEPKTKEYLLVALRAFEPDVLAAIEHSSHGTCKLKTEFLRDFVMPLPPLAEQRRIVAKVEQLMALVDALETQLAASRATGADLMKAVVAELTAEA